MTPIVEFDFLKLRNFVQTARNYAGGGRVRNLTDCEETYSVARNGQSVVVLSGRCNDDGRMVYAVEESVLDTYYGEIGSIL